MGIHVYYGVGIWRPVSLSLIATVTVPPVPAPAPNQTNTTSPTNTPNTTNPTNNNSNATNTTGIANSNTTSNVPSPLIDSSSSIVTTTVKTIQTLSQTPNIMMIVKSIKPVLFAIEEYSYFLLFTQKNPQTSIFYEFCFNSTWKKWEPDYIANIPLMHTPRFNEVDTNDYSRTPWTLK